MGRWLHTDMVYLPLGNRDVKR